MLGIDDETLFNPDVFPHWLDLINDLKKEPEISQIISVDNLEELMRDDKNQSFTLKPFIHFHESYSKDSLIQIKTRLFNDLPFYEGLLYNKKSGAVRAALYMDQAIVNTAARKDFVIKKLIPRIEAFESAAQERLRVS
ncbi:hypothetical protein RZS08_17485, partial [Arthrospira platensis SPKY1]|nr:hypothetical protein [Arthrospira platensis SPKY1]